MKKFLITIFYFLSSKAVFAEEIRSGGGPISLPNPLNVGSVPELLNNIAGYFIYISIPVVTIMIVYGAFQILTAAGSPEKFKSGKQTIVYAIIGFIIVILAKGITALIEEILIRG